MYPVNYVFELYDIWYMTMTLFYIKRMSIYIIGGW